MSMTVVNSTTRLISMLQFFGMFFLAFCLACFGFYKSMDLSNEIPAKEQALLKDKAQAIKLFGSLSNNLQQFEEGQLKLDGNATSHMSKCQSDLSNLHGLLDVKSNTDFKDVKDVLRMADRYFVSIKKTGQSVDPLKGNISDLQQKLTALTAETTQLNKDNAQLQKENDRLQNRVDALSDRLANCK